MQQVFHSSVTISISFSQLLAPLAVEAIEAAAAKYGSYPTLEYVHFTRTCMCMLCVHGHTCFLQRANWKLRLIP